MLAVVDAYAVCAALLGVARMLLSPRASRLRLFHLPDTLAAYLMRWTRRLVIIAVFGYAIGEVGLLLGLSDVAHDGLQKATGFVLHACLAIIVLQKRRAVRRRLRAPPGATGATARLRNALASVWHWIALFFIVAIWLVWAVEIPDGFTRLLHFFIVTALLLIGARLVLILLDGSLDRALSVPPETAARYPGLEARLRLYHPAVSALLRAVIYVLCAAGAAAALRLRRLHLVRRERPRPARRLRPRHARRHAIARLRGLGGGQRGDPAASGETRQGPAAGAVGAAAHACCRCCGRRW